MKKMTKILLAAGGAALICGGSVMTYLKAQTPMTIQEELTLANLEAMGAFRDGPSMLGCKYKKHATCYVFDGDDNLVDRRKNEYPGE